MEEKRGLWSRFELLGAVEVLMSAVRFGELADIRAVMDRLEAVLWKSEQEARDGHLGTDTAQNCFTRPHTTKW